MIHFEIEFLICFTKPKSNGKTGSKIKTQKNNKNKSSVGLNSEKVNDGKLSEITDEYAHDWCHIEYCMLDNVLPVVEINVATWGAGTYVFIEDYCQLVSTILINDTVWINFTICHKTIEFDNEEIIQFKNNPVIFTISQNQAKNIPVSDKENWKKQFIIGKRTSATKHSNRKWFTKLLEINFSFDKLKYDETYAGEEYRRNKPNKNTTKPLLEELPFKEIIRNKISDINQMFKCQPQYIKTNVNQQKNKKGASGKTDNKNINVASSTGEVAKLYLKSEELVGGKYPVLAEKQVSESTIKYIGVFAKSTKIMTDEQNVSFLPLIVSLKSIEDLPLIFLEKMNLEKIYAEYEFANVIETTETAKFIIKEKDIFIEDTRVFFLSEPGERELFNGIRCSELKLQEALSTRMLVVKFYGEEKKAELPQGASLFGDNSLDTFISIPGHEIFLSYKNKIMKGPVFLGSAGFKLIQLLNGFSVIESSSVLTSIPMLTWDLTSEWEMFMKETWNNQERESLLKKLSLRGQIPDPLLLENCTRVTVGVSSPYTLINLSLQDQLHLPNIYHRIAVVFKNKKFAFDILKAIKSLNDLIVDPSSKPISFENSAIRGCGKSDYNGSETCLYEYQLSPFCNSLLNAVEDLTDNSMSLLPLSKIITGFFLDDEEECIMVLEGSPCIFLNISKMLASMVLPKDGKVMFDNTLFFTQRLYNNFCPLLNIFYMQLKIPLDTLLQQASHYKAKCLSDKSVQALLRLDMLRRSPTLDCITSNQLFPSYNQLINFNLSFGVTVNIEG